MQPEQTWMDLARASENGLFLTITERKSGRTLARFDLTAEHASDHLHVVVPTNERGALGDQLRGGEGGCGDLDEPTLDAVIAVAEHWIAAQASLLPSEGVHELRIRAVGANSPIRAWPLASVRPPPVGDTLPKSVDDLGGDFRPVEALQRGMGNILDGTYRLVQTIENGHRAIDGRGARMAELHTGLVGVLHDAVAKADARLAQASERAAADLDAQAKRHAAEIARLEQRHAAELERSEAQHAKEVARLDGLLAAAQAQLRQAEQRLEFLGAKIIQVEREGGLGVVDAKNQERIASEIGASLRSFAELAAKAGILYALRDRLDPAMISAATQAMSLSPETLDVLNDPRVAALLDNPAVQRLLSEPEAMKALGPLLENPEALRGLLAAGSNS